MTTTTRKNIDYYINIVNEYAVKLHEFKENTFERDVFETGLHNAAGLILTRLNQGETPTVKLNEQAATMFPVVAEELSKAGCQG